MTDMAVQRSLKDLVYSLSYDHSRFLQLVECMHLYSEDGAQADVAALLSMADGARKLIDSIAAWREDSQPLKIAIAGDYSAGKSSFINHLLDDATLCPVRDDPTTSYVTAFKYGLDESIVRTSASGRTTKLTREAYHDQVQASGIGRATGRPRRFTITTPIAVLQGIELLDTPGFNNLRNASDTLVTENVLAGMDAVLFLVDVNTGTIPESGAQRLRALRELLPQATIRVMFTKSDAKAPGRLSLLTKDCQHRHAGLFDGDVLAYSTQDTGRTDIATREGIAALLQGMASARRDPAVQDIRSAVHQHNFQCQELLQRCYARLTARIAAQTARGVKAARNKQRLSERFDRMMVDFFPSYKSETQAVLRASFGVKEIAGTGWIFKDASIVRVAPSLHVALARFRPVEQMRIQLRAEVARCIDEETAEALRSIDNVCARATADTVPKAETLVNVNLGYLLIQKFDYDTAARAKLDDTLRHATSAIVDSLWNDWTLWLTGLHDNLADHYITPVIDDAHEQVQRMQDMLASCRSKLHITEPTALETT